MRPSNLILAMALPLASLEAQTAVPDSGDRVRIHFTEARKSQLVTGTLVFQDADSVTLLEEVRAGSVAVSSRVGQPSVRVTAQRQFSVLRPQISRLEVSTGRRSMAGTGALIGAGVGVAGGAALGVAALCSNSDGFLCLETGGQVVAVAAVTGALGAAIGAIVGLCIHHEKWVTAGDALHASVILRPSEHEAAVGLAVRF